MIRRPFFALMMSAVTFTAVMADVPLDQCSQIEQAEKSPLSPFDGMILLKSNILKNMRLYGLYASEENEIKEALPPHPAFVKAGKPEFLKNNVPVEPIGALAQYLFPSVDGTTLTHNERNKDFWGFIARSQKGEKKGVTLINNLLTALLKEEGPLSPQVLKGEEKLDGEKLEKVVNDWVDEVNEKATGKNKVENKNKELGNVKTVLLEALKTTVSPLDKKKGAVYPPHVALHLLVAFAFRISDSAEEFAHLKAVVELNKNAPLFSKEAYDKGINPFKTKFTSKDSVDISPKEIFLFAQGYETYVGIVPSLVPYQTTTYTPPSSDKQQRAPISYPDCGETSLLNFFRIVLGKDGQFSPDYVADLKAKLSLSDQEKTKAHNAFLAFFRENPDFPKAFTAKGHAAWSQVVSNLNNESSDSGNQVDYLSGKSTCEMNAGVINMLSVIEKLIPHKDLTKKWTEKPEMLEKAMHQKDQLTEDEKKELKLVLTQAADKLTTLCELFSREGFQLDWSCKGEKTLPAITGIDVSFAINDKPAFTWELTPDHFELTDNAGKKNSWKENISFENTHLKDSPLLQSFLIKPSDVDAANRATDTAPVHHFHLWGLSISDLNIASIIVQNISDRVKYNPTANLLHQVNGIVGKVFPEGDREAQGRLLRVMNLLSKKLIRQVPLLNQVQQGALLLTAVKKGDGSGAKELLEQKAPVNFKDDEGETPLHWAARKNNAEIAKLLIDNKASVDAETYFQDTPLHMAAQNGSKNVAALLLEKGASVNIINGPSKETPLHCAADYGHGTVVKLLLKNNASVDVKDRRGKTPLDLAQDKGHEDIVELLKEHGKKQATGHD